MKYTFLIEGEPKRYSLEVEAASLKEAVGKSVSSVDWKPVFHGEETPQECQLIEAFEGEKELSLELPELSEIFET